MWTYWYIILRSIVVAWSFLILYFLFLLSIYHFDVCLCLCVYFHLVCVISIIIWHGSTICFQYFMMMMMMHTRMRRTLIDVQNNQPLFGVCVQFDFCCRCCYVCYWKFAFYIHFITLLSNWLIVRVFFFFFLSSRQLLLLPLLLIELTCVTHV